MSNAPTVSQYMSRFPHTIPRGQNLSDAHALMRKFQLRHLPVIDDSDNLVGLLSIRDLHLVETLADVDPDRVPVEDAMSDDPYVVGPNEPIDQIAAIMADRKIGSAVVVDDGAIAGIFTTTDALIALLHAWKPR